MSNNNNFIQWFKDIGLDHVPSVGGKGASLGELMRAGISIPDGFVVTTTAFHEFMQTLNEELGIINLINRLDPENLDEITAVTKTIRARIEQTELPASLLQTITEACEALGDAQTPVAVRSSATSEDSEDASFAGLQDTYLWVKGTADIIKWVRSCWASLYSPESVAYRLRLKLPEEQLGMGVVVQTMVNSRCSGVMFTRSPTTGDRSVITIESSWGLGSSIVSGEVTPDKFVINRVTGEIPKRDIANKTLEHIPSNEGGIIEQTVPTDRQNLSSINDDELKDLVIIAKKVEAHYGKPQDIEWAIDQNNNILLLQSRPETVWANKDSAPLAKPTANPFDHVFALMGGVKKQ